MATAPISPTRAPIALIEQDSPLPVPSEIFLEIVAGGFKPSDIHAYRLSCRQIDRWMQNDGIWQRLFSRDFKGLEKSEGQSFHGAYRAHDLFRTNIAKGIYAANGTIPTHGPGRPQTVFFRDVEPVQPHCVTFDRQHLGRMFTSFLAGAGKLFLGEATGVIHFFDLKTGQYSGQFSRPFVGCQGASHSLAIAEGMLISGSCDRLFPEESDVKSRSWSFNFWHLESELHLFETRLQTNELAYSVEKQGKRIEISEEIKIFDPESGVCLHQVEGRRKPIILHHPYSLISAGGLLIASVGDNSMSNAISALHVWELESGKKLNYFSSVGHVRLAQDGFEFNMESIDRFMGSYDGLSGRVGQLFFPYGHVLDFIAEDSVIFREISSLFRRDEHLSAIGRFSRMPARARNAIYGKLYDILKPFANDYWGCSEDAFHDRRGQSSTPEQKAQAIEAYLNGAK